MSNKLIKETTRSEMKAEAIKRMKALDIYAPIIGDFKRDNQVSYSDCGIVFYLDKEQEAKVRTLEKEHNILIYHVIRTYFTFGVVDSFLYVGNDKKEWAYEEGDTPFVYCWNYDHPYWSEFGNIGIKRMAGGLVRVA